MGPLVARATHEGYKQGPKPAPFYGYYFAILTGQGPHAPGGARSYLVDGRMTRGFALIAWPAAYRVSGVKTFMVDASGIVYEKDLGNDTRTQASAMTAFDVDDSWTPVRAVH